MEHTQTPWEWSEHKFNAPPFEGTLEHECGIYPVPDGEIGPVAIASGKENARRIVACANACAGVTTEELEQGGFVTGLIERLEEKERQRDALQEELENIATAEWREFDPDTRRCAYEFVLWAQSRARHTLNRVLSGDVTAPLQEDEEPEWQSDVQAAFGGIVQTPQG